MLFMKRKGKYLVAIAIVFLFAGIVTINLRQINDDEKDYQHIEIPIIEFPQYAGEYNDDIIFELKMLKKNR